MDFSLKPLTLVQNIVKQYPSVLVAFSGGVDSTFLLKICADTLGTQNVLAVTGASETYTAAELEGARQLARAFGVEQVVIRTTELADAQFAANSPRRCYYCKKNFYAQVVHVAQEKNIRVVFDGSNRDDEGDYRPGREAARELGVISPLLEAGFTKEDIRAHAKALGLPVWNKPANPCLASRFPYGTPITKTKLAVVEQAEAALKQEGFEIVRVRHHGDIARLEVPPDDLAKMFADERRTRIVTTLKNLGFTYVTLDLEGFRSGSLNAVLTNHPEGV